MGRIDDIERLVRYTFEVDEDLVELASHYFDNPNSLAADLRNLVVDRFQKTFQKRARPHTWWRFWEWTNPFNQEWAVVGGRGSYGWQSISDEHCEYLLELDRTIEAVKLVSQRSSSPVLGELLKQLIEFRESCGAIRHAKRPPLGEPDEYSIRRSLVDFERWVKFESKVGEAVAEMTEQTIGGSAEVVVGGEVIAEGSQSVPVTVNALMLDIMQSVGNEECLGWSVEVWREKLLERFGRKPSKSTIHKQPTWDLIRTLRVQSGVESHEHQTTRDQMGKRRSRVD